MSRCSCLPVHPARGVHYLPVGFPGGSDGEESICNAGDPGSIPGSGRSPGEGIGCLLQNAWASLVAQLVKNPPAVRETWVQSLGWEDPLEMGKATHSSILAWRIPCMVQGVAKSGTRLCDSHLHYPLVSTGGSNLNKTSPGSYPGLACGGPGPLICCSSPSSA